jgi:hypothetical protein
MEVNDYLLKFEIWDTAGIFSKNNNYRTGTFSKFRTNVL